MTLSPERVEKAAKALRDRAESDLTIYTNGNDIYLAEATAAISAYLGDDVVVPREPDLNMIAAWYRYKSGFRFPNEDPARDTSDYGAYRAMISAAPPLNTGDVRKGDV